MRNETQLREAIAETVNLAQAQTPLVPSITNNVTIDFVANAQLAVGGSAAMVYMAEEACAMAQAAQAMYFNLGTLVPLLEEAILTAARNLHEMAKPYVIDPVGLGIGSERTRILEALRSYKPSIIRGNASEIIGLAGLWNLEGTAEETARVRGVDTTDSVEAAQTAAVALARYTGGAVAVSGEVDLITDGETVALSYGGSKLMTRITGCGCSLGGVMAVYAALTDPFTAALTGAVIYNYAASQAAAEAAGPASFKVAFLDHLYVAKGADVAANPFVLKEA